MKSDQKYDVHQYPVSALLTYVENKEIAIPEIQRPFVWNASKVRDLIDSLFQGYPVGYIVTWQNPTVKLKDGSAAAGKKILIDGQQRVTALSAAILGHTVKNADYEDVRIRIAFQPVERRFEVCNPAIEKDKQWIADIAPLLSGEASIFDLFGNYCEANPDTDRKALQQVLQDLQGITGKVVGVIELHGDLDMQAVTEIFIRINSQGVALGQADFVMSKIAANEEYGGNMLRKCIDHFAHLAVKPEFYGKLKENDKDFVASEYFRKVEWLRNENDDIYDPQYEDILRVVLTYKFSRGKMGDLVSLLSGRNFETHDFEQAIEQETYKRLREGLLDFINKYNFQHFVMIVRSAGFCNSSMIGSQNVLNFCYALYLKLRSMGCASETIERCVRRWMVMAFITKRYSSSPESQFDQDIKQVEEQGIEKMLGDVEAGQMSDAFWDVELVQRLATTSRNPLYNVLLASQCKTGVRGFLSTDITVKDMIEQSGDIHHIFPQDYLKKNGLPRSKYNQVANYAYVQTEINIKIGKRSPDDYLGYVANHQCQGGAKKYGGIDSAADLAENLAENCIPPSTPTLSLTGYETFLAERRVLIARRLKEYYQSL